MVSRVTGTSAEVPADRSAHRSFSRLSRHHAIFFYRIISTVPTALKPGSGRALALCVESLTSNGRTHVLDGVSHARYANGQLFFLRGTRLMPQRFDARRL